jgi:hypothetical protein
MLTLIKLPEYTLGPQAEAIVTWWEKEIGVGTPVSRASVVARFPRDLVETRQNPLRVLRHHIGEFKQMGFIVEDGVRAPRELK